MPSNEPNPTQVGHYGSVKRLVYEMAVELVADALGAVDASHVNALVMDDDSIVAAAAYTCEVASIAGHDRAVEHGRHLVNKTLVDF